MKDEEMAEENFEQYRTKDIDYVVSPYSEDNGTQKLMFNNEYDAEEEYFRFYKQGFLAGLKAGRPQWHKADVPTSPINKVVLGYIKHYNSKQFCLVRCNGEWWYDAGTYNDEVKLIAWCEIPTFDKE